MNELAVSLETAEQLKLAGFPQYETWFTYTFDDLVDRSTADRTDPDYKYSIAAPTAQDVSDNLSASIRRDHFTDYFLRTRKEGLRNYSAFYDCPVHSDDSMVFADRLEYGFGRNIAEALAALYLKLHEASA